jgi:beta-xylosidase
MTVLGGRRGRVLLVAALGALLVAVVVVVSDPERRCRGVELRGGAPVDVEVGDRPLGGGGLRELFGGGQVAYCDDFADPYVLVVEGQHFAFSTSSDGMLVPVLTAGNLFRAGDRRDALAGLPGWAAQDATRVWAPSVLARGDRYVLYYTLGMPDGRQCVSVAVADDPAGPFTDRSTGPLVCPETAGAIDPSPFVSADGRAFLSWKDVGEGAIMASELSAEGTQPVGDAHVLIYADQAWEAGVVEGPSLVEDRGRFYLFYSGNDWRTANYAVGYAVCETPLGPCAKPADAPWLAASDGAQGPGGPELFRDSDRLWMVVHAWVGGRVGYPDGARNLFVLRVAFTPGGPVAA